MGVTTASLVAGDGPAAAAIAERLARDGLRVARLHEGGSSGDLAAIVHETATAIEAMGALAVAVTAYARRDAGPFLLASETDWRERLDRELTAPFFVAQTAARAFAADRRAGAIVHVIERADQPGASCKVTENACRLMIAATALDLIPSGVRVCGVSGAGAPSLDGAYRETIAAAVAFCASPDASYVVGSTFDPWNTHEARWP